MENILLVGYGGHAKSIADCIERQGNYRIAGYTDSMQRESPYKYLGTDERLQECYDNGIKKQLLELVIWVREKYEKQYMIH